MNRNIILAILFLCTFSLAYGKKNQPASVDRAYWTELCFKTAAPILSNMSQGTLKKNMTLEFSPTWDGRDKSVAYMEAFGRLMAGIAPWLSLPDDGSAESHQREQLRDWAIKSYSNAVDPDSPDYLGWEAHSQALVDAAYIANSFIRAPETLWQPLDKLTKDRYVQHFKSLRKIKPPYNNWLLFRAMIEAFFVTIGEEYDGFALELTLRKVNEWYVGDGWYSDGAAYSFDYYNGYVMHPMYIEIIEILENNNISTPVSFDLQLRRMQRYNHFLERLISPEGTYPPFGRSVTYRMGAFQPVALSAWKYGLPDNLSNGQIRSALTTVMKNMFSAKDNFNAEGFLQLGFVGHQPELADYYTNTGSLYITSLVFLPLGLDLDHEFWTSPSEDWTARKAWKGETFPKDYHQSIIK